MGAKRGCREQVLKESEMVARKEKGDVHAGPSRNKKITAGVNRTMYEIVKQRGTVVERIPGTPLFLSEEDALAYASIYAEEHPDEFKSAVGVYGIRRKGSIGPTKSRAL
jgi:hypothetical protein